MMLVPVSGAAPTVSGAAPTVYGIVPDGATVSGRGAKVARARNAFMVRPTARHPGTFTIRTTHGATVTTAIPSATGHRQQR